MSGQPKRYTGVAVDVTFDAQRCIHAAECVRGLPAVFDTSQRPWIQPANAGADAIVAVVARCPSGALHYERKDGAAAETADERNVVTVRADGPLHVRGDVTLKSAAGEITATDMRLALCRCGHSQNKPFCDNSHKAAGFSDVGAVKPRQADEFVRGGPLVITTNANGSLQCEGNIEVVSADGTNTFSGSKTWLCRCGGSANKPFCDGTHKRNGFQA